MKNHVFSPAFLLLGSILFVACNPESTEPVTVVEAPAEKPSEATTRYAWHAGDTPAGETVIVRAGDGQVSNESFVHWNNREYRVNTELQLDADGFISALVITGTSPFNAPLQEQFSYEGGVATWRTTGEQGSVRSEQPAFYVSNEWGAMASLEALVRAGVKNIGGDIPLFPNGVARVEPVISTTVPVNGGETELTLYAIHGLGFSPTYAWFDPELQLIARDIGRMGMLPEGWDRSILQQLGKLQAEQDALYYEQLSQRLSLPANVPLVFENVGVLDVEAGERLDGRHVLIVDGVIVEVSESPIEANEALRIDGNGKTLMPGLWDMHGHFSLDDGILNIAGGITSVRDLGSTHERIMELEEAFNSGRVIGPTTYRAAMIDQAGPYANRNPVESLDEALALIDQFAAQGYLQIKLYSSIDPQWVPAIAERVHSNGMRLSGHVPAFMSAEQAVRAGYDEIQHINMVFLNFSVGDRGDTRQQIRFTTYGDEAGELDLESDEVRDFVALLLENEVVIDPTAAIFQSMMTHVPGQVDPTFAAVSDRFPALVQRDLLNPAFEIGEARVPAWARSADRQSEMIRLLWESGVPLVAGSDSLPGFTIHRELELYSVAGIPNADVLRIATLGSAEIVGVDDRTGSISPGKAADLVLLGANPLDDISAIRRAELVIKGQTMYRPDDLYTAVGVKPSGG